jgi:hypothetical protein
VGECRRGGWARLPKLTGIETLPQMNRLEE